ncbi:MAG: menaquinone biosynthesis protein [Syntrophobacteraceae bacterium]|nr:menaquinone biosynthesis protein [Syntrophobacteraceae bacterium]
MGSSPGRRLRLGRIGFLNVLPIYYPLECGILPHPFEIISGTPAYLNGLMAEGKLDLSVVSSIEYARHPGRYYILPNLSISCRGPVKSVLLMSRVPVRELSGQTILVSAQSHTSVALLRILFDFSLGVRANFDVGDCTEALSQNRYPTAFLAIGDEALVLRNHSLYPHVLDLGEAWHSWTGIPFVFAVWIIQREAVEGGNGELGPALETLSRAKKWGRDHLDPVCREASLRGVLSRHGLHDYYRCLRYELGDEEVRGLRLFFQFLVKMGEIGEEPPVDIFPAPAGVV